MNTSSKIHDKTALKRILTFQHKNGVGLVLATGCYDVLHRGHIELLEAASEYGHLFVGINDDKSIGKLKGPRRPINKQEDRLRVMAALSCVQAVFLIHSEKVTEAIKMVAPDYWVKGGDYSMDTLDKGEVEAAREAGTEIVLVPLFEGYGYSTTSILGRC